MVVGDFANEVDELVVGGGPGGYVAAIRAAQLGRKVTLVDKGELGGVCLNRGCIPAKARCSAAERGQQVRGAGRMGIRVSGDITVELRELMNWKDGVVKKLSGGVGTLLKGNKVGVIKG